MIVNTQGIELNNNTYITEAGQYAFKIEKFEENGVSSYNSPAFKLHFIGNKIIVGQDGKPALGDEEFIHTERYTLDENVLWKIKILEVALDAPEIYDINDFVGRYVVADVGLREHNGKMYSDIKKWKPSKRNDALPPIPKAEENQNNSNSQYPQPDSVPVIDIDESEIPF